MNRLCLSFLLVSLLLTVAPASAYSVLTHQAVVDSTWDGHLRPLLEKRYPGASPAELNDAKSYAYGGAIIQDMGYYPLGTELLTNMMHYARAGDFVHNLLTLARDRNEYAFALGALSHYVADNIGHPQSTNQLLSTVYTDLKKGFGPVVTYEQAPIRHTELEFSFDVVQVAAGRYRTQDYHKAIGFRVSKPVLERAIQATYGLELGHVTLNVDLSVATFRFAVNQLMPSVARAAWHSQRKEIRRVSPRARRRDYVYHTSRREFEKDFGKDYERPGFGARMMARVINVLPKIGPLRKFTFTLPSREGEAQFRRSFAAVLTDYNARIQQEPTDTAKRIPALPNTNLDTGLTTKAGQYALADETYGEWLLEWHKHDFEHLTPDIQKQLLAYFERVIKVGPAESSAAAEGPSKKDIKKVKEALEALRNKQ